MKKGHIRVLVAVMSVASLTLLAVQWFWVRNAVALREKQFQQHVSIALHRVAERLQDREITLAIGNARMLGLPFIRPASWENEEPIAHPERCDPRMKPLCLKPDSFPTRVTRHNLQSRRWINGQLVADMNTHTRVLESDSETVIMQTNASPEAMDYMHGFVERMLQGARPIEERLNLALLDTLLRQELARSQIEEPYVYDVHTEGFVASLTSRRKQEESPIDRERAYYRVQLFPHDLQPSEHFLELQFPERSSPTMRAMGLVLPTSGILIVIVLACFGVALVAFRRQQKLSDLKTDFINNMTHELKTPISTISLALEALGDPDMQTQERIKLYARMIGQENERLKTQVDRVLQAAAMERGELKLSLETVDVDLLLCEQIERIRMHVESRGGTITYTPEAEEPNVEADVVHLGGVIFNLLDNANKYSPDKPTIEVGCRNVPGGIEVTVTDHGLGIDGDAQRRVFEKFYRVPTGNVHDVKGFGIGLSYARTMARAHGGDLTLQSASGQGSTFTLFIPQKS